MKEFERPKNNLALAIVGAVFFWPTAIAGIIRAAKGFHCKPSLYVLLT